MRNICIFLTACVNPNGMIYTKLQDAEARANQYLEALNFYLTETNIKVVFAENTLFDASERFREYINSGRLEYITFDGNHFDKFLGKGYGEYEIIKYAQEHSTILKESDIIVKITGRIKVLNINNILNSYAMSFKNPFQCMFRMRDFLWSMVFIIKRDTLFDIILSDGDKINDSREIYFEHILYYGLLKDNSVSVLPFLEAPIIDGTCGSSNVSYSSLIGEYNLKNNIMLISSFYKFAKRNADAAIMIKLLENLIT